MAKYRQLHAKFWTDPRVIDLTPTQKNLFIYAITGKEACSLTHHTSGIYEVSRGALQLYLNRDISEIEKDLDFFNKNRPMLLEYDGKNHIIFVKSFFKYNTSHKSAAQNLFEDFNETYRKAQDFWLQFSEIHRERIRKIYHASSGEQKDFLEKLINLKDYPNPNFEVLNIDKVLKFQNQK